MHTEIIIINNSSNGQLVKSLHDYVIHINVIFPYAFFSKCEKLRHCSAFMIASQQCHLLRRLYLQSK